MLTEIVWKVTPQEATQILNALTEKPYRDVVKLINKLNMAATEQVAAYEKEKDGNSNTG